MQKLDLTNQKFGKWTALKAGVKKSYWLCQCDCGKEKEVFIGSLRYGSSTQCPSCASKGNLWSTTHGMHKSITYTSWRTMKYRCYDTNHENYPYYGAIGIKVCERWLNSFQNFYDDMGERPSKNYTMDRIDPYKDYEPGNCRWATVTEQNRNKRKSIFVTYKEQKRSLSEICDENNKSADYQTIAERVRRGWEVEKALSTPIRRFKTYTKTGIKEE
jgi:hypothetical protein